MNKEKFVCTSDETRLDVFLTSQIPSTRNQIETLIKNGLVSVDGAIVKKCGAKIKNLQEITVDFPAPEIPKKNAIDFDIEVIFEDEDILILNKPPNLVIHDAPSVKESTLVDWLKAKGIALSTLAGEVRHGIVHRLDKETSGAIAIAKNNAAHANLSAQLKERTLGRYYLALIDLPLKDSIIIDKPLGRNPKNRLKMSVVKEGRESKSAFAKVAANEKKEELIAAKLFSGRTHQIRAHLESINRHILGDCLYGFKGDTTTIPRVFLHSYLLYLNHPRTGKKIHFVAKMHEDMKHYLRENFSLEEHDAIFSEDSIRDRFNFCLCGV